METKKVELFYEELRKTFVKPDSSWTDKCGIYRTILEQFFIQLTPELNREINNNLFHRIDAFYDQHPEQEEMRAKAHRVRKATNDIVHNRLDFSSDTIRRVEKPRDTIRKIFEDIVMIIYNATELMPDDATFAILGVNRSDCLNGLNEQQKDAILCDSRIVFVNAGPGTGKTHLLVHELIHHVIKHPELPNLVALSFTNTAASQLGEKFGNKAFKYLHDKDYVFFNGTIHSFCLRNLRKYHAINKLPFNYMIIGDEDLFELAPDISALARNELTIQEVMEYLGSGKLSWPEVLTKAIAQLKSNYQLIGLGDILSLFLNQLNNDEDFARWLMSSVDLIVIDEAQDLNEDNFKILDRMLALKPSLKLFLVGDPRQNIFEFNGGSYQHLEDFLGRHPGETDTRFLSTSYRCPNEILSFANSFQFTDCKNFPLTSSLHGSISVKGLADEADEADFVIGDIKTKGDVNSCAVISSTIKGMATLIDKLNAQGIPYLVFGGKRRLKAHVRLTNNLLRILQNNNEKSIRSVAKALNLDVKTQPLGAPRHFTPKELFYQTPLGRKLRTLAKEYATQGWPLPALAEKIIEGFIPKELTSSPQASEDLRHLQVMLKGYSSIKEYLDAFSINKERFLAFYEKEFKESVTPVVDSWLTLSTIHSAKGLEWEHVYIIGMYELNFPGVEKYKNKTLAKQEKYLNNKKKEMYVAVTRSRKDLTLTYPESVEGKDQAPSKFIPNPATL